MTELELEHCELTYDGAFGRPAFGLSDSPGRVCDLLLEALEPFGSTSDDLSFEEGEPNERGVACEVDNLDARVTLRGDGLEVYCRNFEMETAADLGAMLDRLWSSLKGGAGIAFVYFYADANIKRNVPGQGGWLNKIRLGIEDYEQIVYLSDYNR